MTAMPVQQTTATAVDQATPPDPQREMREFYDRRSGRNDAPVAIAFRLYDLCDRDDQPRYQALLSLAINGYPGYYWGGLPGIQHLAGEMERQGVDRSHIIAAVSKTIYWYFAAGENPAAPTAGHGEMPTYLGSS